MGKFNTLYRGTAENVADFLENNPATDDELRAALINALRRIEVLEGEVRTLKNPTRESTPLRRKKTA